MYALFFLTCLTGSPDCYQLVPDNGQYYTYPDQQNCESDKHNRGLGKLYQCLPVMVISGRK